MKPLFIGEFSNIKLSINVNSLYHVKVENYVLIFWSEVL
jgi:hypothetical protein